MRKFFKQGFLAAALLIMTTVVFAGSPLTMLSGASNNIIRALEKNKASIRRSRTPIIRMLNRYLVPHIDANRMARSVVGPRYWNSASSAARAQFIREFKRLVMGTYADALASYNGDRVHFYPYRGSGSTAHVRSVIVRRSGQRIPVSYNLVRSGSRWKIVDFSIENISMVQSYRSQFRGALAQGGLARLVKRLRSHNGRR